MVVGKTVAYGIGLVPVPLSGITTELPLVGVTVTVAVREPVELAPGAKVTVMLQVLRALSVVPLDPPQLSDSVKAVAFVPPHKTLVRGRCELVPWLIT